MAFKIANRTRETTSTTGAIGPGVVITLSGVTNSDLQSFSASVGDANSTFVCAVSGSGSDWQEFIGTVDDADPDTLTVVSVLNSSAGGTTPISLTGTSRVFGIIPPDFSALLDQVFGNVQGSLLLRGALVWSTLPPGAADEFLKSDGTNLGWAAVGSGSVDLDALLDALAGTDQGTLLQRGAAGWEGFAPATAAGVTLKSGGPGASNFWEPSAYPTWRPAATVITAAPLSACTYNNGASGVGATLTADANGALTIDGAAFPFLDVGWRVLINDQVDQTENGVYVVTDLGSAGTPWVLTRSPGDGDGTDGFFEMGQTYGVVGGTVNSHTLWQLSWDTIDPIVFGTDSIIFTQLGGTILGGLDSISNTEGDYLRRGSGAWSGVRPHYGVSFSAPQTTAYSNGQVVGHHPFSVGVTFPADFGAYMGRSSRAGGSANAAASTVVSVQRCLAADDPTDEGDWTQVGTITFAAGTVTPTFATTGGLAITFATGDRMRLKMPAVADTTFAGFFSNMVGYET